MFIQYKADQFIKPGQLIRVHRSENKERHWLSISNLDGEVIAEAIELRMKNCTFIFNDGDRETMRRTGKHSVHAWLQGELDLDNQRHKPLIRLYYNPMVTRRFVVANTNNEVHDADYILIDTDSIWVSEPIAE